MVRQWTRAHIAERCGRCGGEIPVGGVLLRIVLVDVRKFRIRCAACTDEPPPTEMPVAVIQPVTWLRRLGYLPLDERPEEREPGCDD